MERKKTVNHSIRRERNLQPSGENSEYWQTNIDEAVRKKTKGSPKLELTSGRG